MGFWQKVEETLLSITVIILCLIVCIAVFGFVIMAIAAKLGFRININF